MVATKKAFFAFLDFITTSVLCLIIPSFQAVHFEFPEFPKSQAEGGTVTRLIPRSQALT